MEKGNWKLLFIYASSQEPRRTNQPIKQRDSTIIINIIIIAIVVVVIVVNLCPEQNTTFVPK